MHTWIKICQQLVGCEPVKRDTETLQEDKNEQDNNKK
jgi:hypothetical protein